VDKLTASSPSSRPSVSRTERITEAVKDSLASRCGWPRNDLQDAGGGAKASTTSSRLRRHGAHRDDPAATAVCARMVVTGSAVFLFGAMASGVGLWNSALDIAGSQSTKAVTDNQLKAKPRQT